MTDRTVLLVAEDERNLATIVRRPKEGGWGLDAVCGVADFHEMNRQRLEHWPLELLATSTHDTKRGEDVRARINVLSEIPDP